MKVLHVVGARPNFMKAAPLIAEMARLPDRFQQILVHTGQHYDDKMSRIFFEELDLSAPTRLLNVGSGSHAEQTARVMMAFEPLVREERPDLTVVVGDVNSTLACALVCAKLGLPVAHVEAGLRSRDRTMPEEINRVLTDQISDLLFTSCREADANLLREGIPSERIHFVGNMMIDTLVRMLPQALARPTLSELELEPQQFVLATFHRPSNVDDPRALEEIVTALNDLAHKWPVIFPVHPRTRQRMAELQAPEHARNLRLLEPLGYLDFLALSHAARLVITDSGGVQEETTYLGVPCITVRPNTERPVTIAEGTNRLVSSTREAIVSAVRDLQACQPPPVRPPEYWDGRAAGRIVEVLCSRNGHSD